MVVYLTLNSECLKEYGDFILMSTKCAGSKAIVNEVTSVHKDLIGDYIGELNEIDLVTLNRGLKNVLDFGASCDEDYDVSQALEDAENEAEHYKRMYEDLVEKLINR